MNTSNPSLSQQIAIGVAMAEIELGISMVRKNYLATKLAVTVATLSSLRDAAEKLKEVIDISHGFRLFLFTQQIEALLEFTQKSASFERIMQENSKRRIIRQTPRA